MTFICVRVPSRSFLPSISPSPSQAEGTHYSYLDLWSSRFTWGGEEVPSEGQLVVVEKGHTVYLDQSTEVLKMLLIKGGRGEGCACV